MQNIKDKIFALPPPVLFLIGVVFLGGAIAGGMYVFKSAQKTCTGTLCSTSTTPIPFQFNEPAQVPHVEDVCGDGICSGNEQLYQNVCPRDCGGVGIPPTIQSFTATPSTIKAGKTVTLSWSSDAIFCAPADDSSSWGWAGGAPKGSLTTEPLSSSQVYSISCMSKDGGMAKESVLVSVIPPPPPPVKTITKKDITITFTAKPETINSGGVTKLSWSSVNTTSCSAEGDGASWGWSGTRPTDGIQPTPPLTSNQTYAIRCRGDGGASALKKVTVTVSSLATAPSISFNAIPTTVPYEGRATLAWIVSNAQSCQTSNSGNYPEWTGTLPEKSLAGGLKTTRPLTGDQVFTITCTNGTGAATATTTKNLSILVDKASNCTIPPWGEIQSGSSIEAFLTPLVAYKETCTSETRTCNNGKLSGSYPYQSCKASEGRDCLLGGTTVKNGESVTAYKNTGGADTACISETRTCDNGTLSGTYLSESCTTSCTTPWKTSIAGGSSVTAYKEKDILNGPCVAEERRCDNGTLTGSYTNKSCDPSAGGGAVSVLGTSGQCSDGYNPGSNICYSCSWTYPAYCKLPSGNIITNPAFWYSGDGGSPIVVCPVGHTLVGSVCTK